MQYVYALKNFLFTFLHFCDLTSSSVLERTRYFAIVIKLAPLSLDCCKAVYELCCRIIIRDYHLSSVSTKINVQMFAICLFVSLGYEEMQAQFSWDDKTIRRTFIRKVQTHEKAKNNHTHLCSFQIMHILSHSLFRKWFKWFCSPVFFYVHQPELCLPAGLCYSYDSAICDSWNYCSLHILVSTAKPYYSLQV